MKLLIEPRPAPDIFDKELELVICVTEGIPPEIYTRAGHAKPDRHFLLGMARTALMAIQEMDPETTVLMNTNSTLLRTGDSTKPLGHELIIVKSTDGAFAALACSDAALAKRLARQAVRQLTGTIRLDVP
ncbi:MAG TPA: hypothetical protein VMC85_18730 [Desulfomonilaceae bacterium]|nr:hypothetical protein [Desulfomonilaceae bacterium]